MSAKSQNAKIIFGLKVKQLRAEKKLSFSELSKQSGMSVSYLNEIEKGKKYPKPEKIESLAAALDTTFKSLTDSDLSQELSPVNDLLQSNFLNELPLDLFGIDLQKVVEMIANAPAKVGAFISTLLELSRNYELREENFYFATMRSYLQLHYNYFIDLEQSVESFVRKYQLPKAAISTDDLQRILENEYDYKIVEKGLDEHPDLKMLRSLYVPRSRKLLLNSNLTETQRAFAFGKELGFNFLKITQRANTSSLLKGRNFEEVLNHSRAIYFSVALLINR
ncbi:MAG: helix-turn-helix domain-containing protein [Saprospiraceae bacterium]